MKVAKFDRPVAIFVGLGFPRDVETVLDAFQVLNEWPNGGRGADHDAALEACRAALTGSNVTTARQAFEAFVHDRNILAPDALAVTANKFAGEWLRT